MSDQEKRSFLSKKLLIPGLLVLIAAAVVVYFLRELSDISRTHQPDPVEEYRREKAEIPENGVAKITPTGKNTVMAERDEIDLEGEREPTEAELVREAISRYLWKMRGMNMLDPEKFKDYPRLRRELEELLRTIPPSIGVPVIRDLLQNEPDFVNRRILLYGLADIGTEEAAGVLKDFFLQHIHDEERGGELRHVIKALGISDNTASFNALYDFARNSDDADIMLYRPFYVEALGKQEQGYKALPLFEDYLLNDQGHTVRNKSAQAIKNVARIDPDAAKKSLPALLEKVKVREDDSQAEGAFMNDSKYVKQTSLGAIGQIGDETTIQSLVDVGTMDELIDVRMSAAAAVSRIGGEEADQALHQILAAQNEQGKTTILHGLMHVGLPRLIPFFHDVAATDASASVRNKAVEAMARIGGDDAEKALRSLLGSETDAGVKETISSKLQLLTKKE